ncbi:MAG: alcohol dehydrogenase catalytic domain-containing protein [Deltaproteobacteria bacterium]|nr:alcohol dehydrogenase catalytic domain-containing protein [Deltaproteobacteria bacterium]
MKAIQLIAPDKLVLAELPSRPLVDRELRVRVVASCICGSDIKNVKSPVLLPQTPGHEFSGTVLEVAPGSDGRVRVGDRVTAFPMIACMKCAACEKENYRDCDAKKSLGFQLPGSFAEEVIFDERFAVPLRKAISYEQGALLEHLCCGYRLAKELVVSQPARDAQIVIVGDGPIALADVQALIAHGYRNITLLGKHPARMALASQFGATVMPAEASIFALIDVCILAAPADSTLSRLLPAMGEGSKVFPQTRIHDPQMLERMKASGIGLGRAFAYAMQDFEDVMSWIEEGKLVTSPLITTRVNLRELPEKFRSFVEKKGHIKVLVVAGGGD